MTSVNIGRTIEKAFYNYANAVDKQVAKFVRKPVANVNILDRFALLVSPVFGIAGCAPVEECDGYELIDIDRDGFCKKGTKISNIECQCFYEIGDIGTDCDDNDENIYNGFNEIDLGLANDGIDNNCDGFVDEINIQDKEFINPNISQNPGYVTITGASRLMFNDRSGVTITTDTFFLGSDSSIELIANSCGAGLGHDGYGSYDGGGGGGGSHLNKGGLGGDGSWSGHGRAGGLTYGSLFGENVTFGSCGGNGGGPIGGKGTFGGGFLSIEANVTHLLGSVIVDGQGGLAPSYDDGGAGGSSGGSVMISSGVIVFDEISTKILARGGKGSDGGAYQNGQGGGGGGGSGGIVKIFFDTQFDIIAGDVCRIYTASDSQATILYVDIIQSGIVDVSGGFGGKAGLCNYVSDYNNERCDYGAGKDGEPGGFAVYSK